MLMNAETLEFVSLAAVSISREVTSVPAPQDTPRVLTENPVLVRALPVRKLKDLKQLCKPCYLMKSLVLNIFRSERGELFPRVDRWKMCAHLLLQNDQSGVLLLGGSGMGPCLQQMPRPGI